MAVITLTPRALYEEVAELLRQRIFARELEPGSGIDEVKIAEAYGISRTPLREALKVLAAEGLVTMKMRRGAYVTEVNEKDLSDVYHLLALLESDAAGVVAERATEAELESLAELRKVMKLNRHQSLLKSGRILEALQEHRLLLQALQSRDAAASAQRMREHFLSGLEAAN
ncbi:MAG: GntR family transcriptional regulator [Limnohabitans sp.]